MKDIIPAANIENLIFQFRGTQVMIDSDLAMLYGTETKKPKQQVKRNPHRFPEDFMFELTKEEKEELIEDNERLNNLKFSPVLPMVFTEHGVMMLSTVLGSETAIAVNIHVMRVFTQMRSTIATNREILLKLEKLSGTVGDHSRAIKRIFNQLNRMVTEEKSQLLLAQMKEQERGKHKPVRGFQSDKDKSKQ